MNRLDPGLRKLIAWSRQTPPSPAPVPPPGLATDVVAAWRSRRPETISEGTLTFIAWTSAAVTLAALAFLLAQPGRPELAPYMDSAAQFLASTLTP